MQSLSRGNPCQKLMEVLIKAGGGIKGLGRARVGAKTCSGPQVCPELSNTQNAHSPGANDAVAISMAPANISPQHLMCIVSTAGQHSYVGAASTGALCVADPHRGALGQPVCANLPASNPWPVHGVGWQAGSRTPDSPSGTADLAGRGWLVWVATTHAGWNQPAGIEVARAKTTSAARGGQCEG